MPMPSRIQDMDQNICEEWCKYWDNGCQVEDCGLLADIIKALVVIKGDDKGNMRVTLKEY